MNAKSVSNVVHCFSSVVCLVMCITSILAEAASYQKINGDIVDPIEYWNPVHPGFHPYTGQNLEPCANLRFADLSGAHLGVAINPAWKLDGRPVGLKQN